MASVSPDELQTIRDDAALLRDEAKSVMRRSRLLVQLAARQVEKVEDLQSKEDTRK